MSAKELADLGIICGIICLVAMLWCEEPTAKLWRMLGVGCIVISAVAWIAVRHG